MEQRPDLCLVKSIPMLRLRQQAQDIVVSYRHAFGLSGRTGSVNDIRQRSRLLLRSTHEQAIPSRWRANRNRCKAWWRSGTARKTQVLPVSTHGRLRVLEHERYAILWVGKIYRHIAAACFEHADNRDNRIRRTLQVKGDGRFGPTPKDAGGRPIDWIARPIRGNSASCPQD